MAMHHPQRQLCMASFLPSYIRVVVGPGILAALLLAPQAAMAVPPPPERADVGVVLLSNGCPTVVEDIVKAYDSPVMQLDVKAGDLLWLRLDEPAAQLEFNLTDADGRSIVAGVGFGSGDARILIPVTGAYSLRVLMSGDAARTGRQIPFRLRITRLPAGEDQVCPADR